MKIIPALIASRRKGEAAPWWHLKTELFYPFTKKFPADFAEERKFFLFNVNPGLFPLIIPPNPFNQEEALVIRTCCDFCHETTNTLSSLSESLGPCGFVTFKNRGYKFT